MPRRHFHTRPRRLGGIPILINRSIWKPRRRHPFNSHRTVTSFTTVKTTETHLTLADEAGSIPVAEQLAKLLHPHRAELGVTDGETTRRLSLHWFIRRFLSKLTDPEADDVSLQCSWRGLHFCFQSSVEGRGLFSTASGSTINTTESIHLWSNGGIIPAPINTQFDACLSEFVHSDKQTSYLLTYVTYCISHLHTSNNTSQSNIYFV